MEAPEPRTGEDAPWESSPVLLGPWLSPDPHPHWQSLARIGTGGLAVPLDKDPNWGRDREPEWGRRLSFPSPGLALFLPGSSRCPIPACHPPTSAGPVGCPSQALSTGGPPPHFHPPPLSGPPPVAGGRALGGSRGSRPPPPRPHPCCAQGQVTRAQEAEENYVIKRELAVVRQQCSSAAEDLQKAQSTIRQLQEQQVQAGVWGC